jgi:predicted  nucleic acid-binding Zn-ribbon protein
MDERHTGGIPQPEEYGEHIARLNAESVQTKQALAWQAKQIERLEQNYQALTTQQTETKTLVLQLHTRFEGLDSRLFGMVQQMTRDSAALLQQITKGQAKERQEGTKERTTAQKAWLGFGKYVIGATIGALIIYLFTKGLGQ